MLSALRSLLFRVPLGRGRTADIRLLQLHGLAVAIAWGACVSSDPTGPHAAAMNGTFTAQVVTVLRNDVEVRQDTSVATLVLRDSMNYGRFYGYYRFTNGDSGLVAGTLYGGGRVAVTQFGYWPPLTNVGHIRELYPACDFIRLAPIYILDGTLQADTLVVNARGTLPCSEPMLGDTVERETVFEFGLVGLRR